MVNNKSKYADVSNIGLINPFNTDQSKFTPDSVEELMRWCLEIYLKSPTFVHGVMWTASHFITDIKIKRGDNAEQEKREEFLKTIKDEIKIMDTMRIIAHDLGCYGNSYVYIQYPFNRVLVDKRNGGYTEYNVDQFAVEDTTFDLDSMTYSIKDPKNPTQKVTLPFIDRQSKNIKDVRLTNLDPARVVPIYSPYNRKGRVVWRIEEDFKSKVKRGDVILVNNTPKSILDTIKGNGYYMFGQDQIYHLKNTFVSGLSKYGIGVPPVWRVFEDIYSLQLSKKADESIAKDFYIPFRGIFPAPARGQDGLAMLSGSEWKQAIVNMMKNRRIDPTSILTMPMPVQFLQFGGDQKQFLPVDIQEYKQSRMMQNYGVPIELEKGSVNIQMIGARTRLFERVWEDLQSYLRSFVTWVTEKIQIYSEGKILFQCELESPDDTIATMLPSIIQQLQASGDISKEEMFRYFHLELDPQSETKKRLKEDQTRQKLEQESQRKLEQELQQGSIGSIVDMRKQQEAEAQQQQQAQGGGSPTGGAQPVSAITPMQLKQQAQELQQKWMHQNDPNGPSFPSNAAYLKEREQVKQTNPDLYNQVVQVLDEMRSNARSQGYQMQKQQQ